MLGNFEPWTFTLCIDIAPMKCMHVKTAYICLRREKAFRSKRAWNKPLYVNLDNVKFETWNIKQKTLVNMDAWQENNSIWPWCKDGLEWKLYISTKWQSHSAKHSHASHNCILSFTSSWSALQAIMFSMMFVSLYVLSLYVQVFWFMLYHVGLTCVIKSSKKKYANLPREWRKWQVIVIKLKIPEWYLLKNVYPWSLEWLKMKPILSTRT